MIEFVILGEPASKANTRKLATVGGEILHHIDGKKTRIGGRVLFIKSAKARDYERAAALQIPDEAKQMLEGPVRVTIKIYYVSQRPDLDESIILDVMQAKFKRVPGKMRKVGNGEYVAGLPERVMVSRGVYLNDRQVREKHVFHFIDNLRPRAEIQVEPMQPQQAVLPVASPAVHSLELNPF